MKVGRLEIKWHQKPRVPDPPLRARYVEDLDRIVCPYCMVLNNVVDERLQGFIGPDVEAHCYRCRQRFVIDARLLPTDLGRMHSVWHGPIDGEGERDGK